MRAYTLFVSLMALVILPLDGLSKTAVSKAPTTRTQDKLLSFSYAFDRTLRPILEQKLLLTPASHGRMIRMHGPFDVGESALSVHCTERGPTTTCFVTLTRAQANMDYTMQVERGNDPLEKVKAISVVRRDCELPLSIATAFRDCLRVMIPDPGDPNQLHPLTVMDDDRIEFWLEEPNAAPRKGERAEAPGRRTKILIRIGELLGRYCEANTTEQARLAKQIKRQATSIVAMEHRKP
ncbi:MAG TPA: hypothetical protein VGW39_10140 [Chthoniobacterales bacterium]|nr:hypothetical protein [Chthoniobacterales bacterium]